MASSSSCSPLCSSSLDQCHSSSSKRASGRKGMEGKRVSTRTSSARPALAMRCMRLAAVLVAVRVTKVDSAHMCLLRRGRDRLAVSDSVRGMDVELKKED